MKKINWKVRIMNKQFWISLIPLVFVLAHQVVRLFGIDIDLSGLSNQLVDIVETLFLILGVIGIVNDPTTSGYGDSMQALTYERPKE